MENNNALDQELPDVGGQRGTGAPARKPFTNALRQTDSVLRATGYINEVRSYTAPGSDSVLYFARVGLVSGRRRVDGSPDDDAQFENIFQNAEFLIGKTLRYWAESVAGMQFNPFEKVRCSMTIRNPTFTPGIHDGKAVLDSRGILEVVEFGTVDH